MTIDQMRDEIAKVYPGESWQAKTNAMCDSQVLAIYHSFLMSGKFKKKKTPGQVYYEGRKHKPCKTVSEAPRTPCERLFVGKTDSCEGGKQVGFDEVLRVDEASLRNRDGDR